MTDLSLGRVKEVRLQHVAHSSTGQEPQTYRILRVYVEREEQETFWLTLLAEDNSLPIPVTEIENAT